jgi:uncharacterized membrane protein
MQSKLTQTALLAAVVGAALSFTAVANAADEAKMEKCYGVAKAGENSCAAKNGAHSCAGQSKTAYDGHEFKAVPAGSCEKMHGKLEAFEGVNPAIKG